MLFLDIFNASILSSVPMNNGVLITLKNSCGARRYEELNFFRISSRNNYPEMFLGKGVLKICSKEHPCWSVILIKLLCNFIEILLWHGYSPVNLLHILQNTFSWGHLWAAASELQENPYTLTAIKSFCVIFYFCLRYFNNNKIFCKLYPFPSLSYHTCFLPHFSVYFRYFC